MMMMMMVPSKAKSGSTRAQGDLKVGRLNRNGSTKSDSQPLEKQSSSPLPKPRGSVDRPTKSFESKVSSKNSTGPPSKPSLQGKLEAVEVELKKETVARMRAEEILAIERGRIEELQIKHEQDASSLSCMAEELHRVKEELRGAKVEKEMILREVDDAKRAAKVHEAKAELAPIEACDQKASHESELEAEIGMLKSELERAKIAEEKLVHMESLIEKLQIEATDARNGESNVCALVERLKAELEEAYQSEKSASDSLADMMVKLEESKSLFEDAELEISILRARISTLEIESARQKIDLEESNRQLELAQQDALNIGKTVELLKLELQRLEEEKLEVANVEKVASLRIESLAEENDKLTAELELSKDEGEKANKAMECLALEFKALSMEAREREERLLRMQTEIEESNKEIDRLSRALQNTKELYEVMLDEARYEFVCLQKRCKDEQSFIGTIRKLEEEIASLKAKHEKNESIGDVELANSCPDKEEPSKNENLEPSETLLDDENEVQSSGVSNTEVEYTEEDRYQEGLTDNGLGLQRQLEEETVDDDLDSKMNSDSVTHTNGTERHKLQRKKKRALVLYNFGNLLRKGNH
ncbi:interactor of constitutive active ROPs 2, chloroplastic-like isoform X1 [Zingiber officinale]|uniref:interactor of constitutive active ROPs 2, chloroplastic-like isoform X1 n=1 Tax=Zingiber officinale TaxID=94328 RepID=UPI001C4BF65D|nr:interactor of constitutive active ROPs 2, chloroplastic-like isoform X1 [Zingiber officinale]